MYSQKFSLIRTHAASHAAVMEAVIDDRADEIHEINGSSTHWIYATPFVKAALIVSQFVITIYASHTIAATISHIGDKTNHIIVANVPNQATITGIASPNTHATVTNQAIAPPIHITQATMSAFSFAQAVNDDISGCTIDNNCNIAGAKAPPIDSCTSQNVSAIILFCHSSVLPKVSACHHTVSINAPKTSSLVALSDNSILYSLSIFWLPAIAIVTALVADHISICLATDKSAASVAAFCAIV